MNGRPYGTTNGHFKGGDWDGWLSRSGGTRVLGRVLDGTAGGGWLDLGSYDELGFGFNGGVGIGGLGLLPHPPQCRDRSAADR